MTDPTETDIVDRLRSACTDWDGSRLSPASEPMDGLHCDVLFDAATEIESLRHELKEAQDKARLHAADAGIAWGHVEGLRKELEASEMFLMALRIAQSAHDGQTDKTGTPYILHPLHVSLMGESADDRVVGLLHDVVEDCPEWPMATLAEYFPPHLIEAVDALTKRDGEDYRAFIDRAKRNEIAARVKMHDIADNMDPARLNKLPLADAARLQRKYSAALRALTEGKEG